MSKAIQQFVVSHGDPREFLKLVMEYAAQGAYLPDDEYPHLNHYPKHVKLAMEIKDGVGIVERSATINSFDPVYDAKSFTEEELDQLDWPTLKSVCNAVGLSHRDRKQLQRKYLELIGSGDDAGEKGFGDKETKVQVAVDKAPRVAKTKKEKVAVEQVVEQVVEQQSEVVAEQSVEE